LDKRGMSTSGEVLQEMIENANWNTILIAACHALNNDIKSGIQGLFPDYSIIQAFDWFEIGRKIAEEKPGFVLLDIELSGVDISRFIQTLREDPVLGKPNVFLLGDNHNLEALSPFQADLVLGKPIDFNKLEAAIRSVERQSDAAVIA
jgi:CheY-like chemotaxis protein